MRKKGIKSKRSSPMEAFTYPGHFPDTIAMLVRRANHIVVGRVFGYLPSASRSL